MKIFAVKLILFVLPFVIYITVLACLPYNYFSFRFCEAMSVYSSNSMLSGPYYPSIKMNMLEEGDLGHGSPYVMKKNVYWETDSYGYRTSPNNSMTDIVMVGDSFTAGYSLTQDETISEVLHKKTGRDVYPYANRNINNLLSDKRFHCMSPKIVIFEQVENFIPSAPKINPLTKPYASLHITNPIVLKLLILLDRVKKIEFLRLLKSKFHHYINYDYKYKNILFSQGDVVNTELDSSKIDTTVETIVDYKNYFSKRGITFIYLPIPRRETVFYDLLPFKHEPKFLSQLIKRLEDQGVTVIDLLNPYMELKREGMFPYHLDDTHWNSIGVNVAATLLVNSISLIDCSR
jgi:alginate O-acetyltransferase complex protein AlgJ